MRRKKRISVMRLILAFTGLIALVLAYLVWTQPLETIKILVALNFVIAGVGQLVRAIFFPELE